MADDINNPLGDAAGSKARKKQLAEIRQAAIEAKSEVRQLGDEFKALQQNASKIGVKEFISSTEVGKVSKLNETMAKMTVSTLKSASARKSFMNDIVKAEQDNAKLLSARDAITKEINSKQAIAQDLGRKAAKELRDAEIQYNEAVATGNKAKIGQAEKDKASAKARALVFEQDKADIEEQTSSLSGQNKLIEERVQLQAASIDKAKAFEKEVVKINKAGGSLLQSFAKLGETLGKNIPVFGDAFNLLFGELGSAAKMYQDAAAQGTGKLGAGLKAATGFAKALSVAMLGGFVNALYEGAKLASDVSVTIRKGLGGAATSAADSMKAVSQAAGNLGMPILKAAGFVGEMNKALGTSLGFTGEQLTTFGVLTDRMGVSADAATHLFKISAKIGKSFKDFTTDIGGAVGKFNALNKTAIAPAAVMESLAHASETVLAANSKNPDALIKAAYGARMMGMEMSKIEEAAKGTLDFENSMANEMEAELLLGKELNLDKLRAAAATGDIATQQAEIQRLIKENGPALKNNVLAQEMFGKAVNMSAEDINKSLNNMDAMGKMTKNDAAATKANNQAKKKSAEEIGQMQFRAAQSLVSLSERIAKFQENIKLGALEFGKQLKAAFDPSNIGASLMRIKDIVIKTFKDAFTGANKNLLSNGGLVGKLLGAGAIAGGTITLGLKGLSALGGVFSKMRGSKMLPMWVRNVASSAVGKAKSLLSGKKPPPLPGQKKGMFSTLMSKIRGKDAPIKGVDKRGRTFFRDASGKRVAAPKPKGGIFSSLKAKIMPSKGKKPSSPGEKKGVLGTLKGFFSKKKAASPIAAAAGAAKGKAVLPKGLTPKTGGLLSGFAEGLKTFGLSAVPILTGAATLSGVIIMLTAAVGFSGLILSLMMPKIVEGMKSVEELDGKALMAGGLGMTAVGAGLTALGVGMAAFTVGGAIGAIGSLFGTDGISKELIKKVEEFGEYDLDVKGITNNAKALGAYALGMAALGVAGVAGAIGSIGNALGTLFDSMVPKDQIQKAKDFGKELLPADNIKKNAQAILDYTLGMAALAAAGIGNAVGSIGSAIGSLFDAMAPKDQLAKAKEFGKELLPAEAIKNNATAVVHYAKAMLALGAAGAGGAIGSLGNLASGVIDGISGFFGGENPIDKAFKGMADFSKQTFDPEKIKNNATAVVEYAKAMGALAAGDGAGFLGSLGNAGKQLVDGLVSFFGGETSKGIPVDKINDFGKLKLDAAGVQKNAKTISSFGNAMSSMKKFDDVAEEMLDGINDVTKASARLSAMKVINSEGVESLNKVITEFLVPLAGVDLSNLETGANQAAKFARVFGRGAMKAQLNVDTVFKTEIDTLAKHIDDTSANEIAELRKQNETMQKNHRDEIKEMRRQTTVMFNTLTDQQRKTVIKLDSFKVGSALANTY